MGAAGANRRDQRGAVAMGEEDKAIETGGNSYAMPVYTADGDVVYTGGGG